MCLFGCAPRPAPVVGDNTVNLPPFLGSEAIQVGAGDSFYEVDGAVLRAILIAANDFLAPVTERTPCADRPEAHRYRFMRQGDVIFVRINEDLAYCGRKTGALDSGASYAISLDGRILRRALDAGPEEPAAVPDQQPPSQEPGELAPPGVSPGMEHIGDGPSKVLPPEFQRDAPPPTPPANTPPDQGGTSKSP